MKEKNLVQMVSERYYKSKQQRKDYEDKWKRFYDQYRSIPKAKGEGKSNIFIPKTFESIETIVPRIVSPYFNLSDSPVSLIGRTQIDNAYAKKNEKEIQYQLFKIDFPMRFDTFVRQMGIYGTSIFKITWRSDFDYDGNWIEVLDIFDFFIDPEASNIDDAMYCIHRKNVSLNYLKKMQQRGLYKNVDKIKFGEGLDQDSINPNVKSDQNFDDAIQEDRQDVILYEYWEDDRIITVANNIVIRDSENPFNHGRKPFIKGSWIDVPFKFYGIGVAEEVDPLQLELNTKRNQRLDNVNLGINKMWLVARSSGIDMGQLVSRPGGVIVVNDINGIKPLDVPDVTQSSYLEEDKILNDIQNTTGISEYIRGASPERRQTAQEVEMKTEQAMSRLDYNFRVVSKVIKDVILMMLKNNQQFITMDKETVAKNNLDEFEYDVLSPEDVNHQFDVIVTVDPAGVMEKQNIQKMMALDGLLKSYGIVSGELINKLVKKLSNDEQVSNEIKKDVDMMLNQKMMQQQQMMMQQIMPQQPQLMRGGQYE